MKNKIVSLLLALGLSNAALANSAKIGYTSDFFYRGEQKALESVQASLDLEQNAAGLQARLHACTNQSVDQGVDSYRLAAGLGSSFGDLLSVYGGFNHFEDVDGEALSEVELSASLDILGNPTVSALRNTDEDLYTFEGSLSHEISLSVADLEVRGSIGNTDITESNNRTYYSAGAGLNRAFGDSIVGVSVDLVDSDDIEREFVFGASIGFNF